MPWPVSAIARRPSRAFAAKLTSACSSGASTPDDVNLDFTNELTASMMASTGGVWAQPVLGRVADASGYAASYLVSAGISAFAKVFRMVLQSAILGLVAYYVIHGEMSGGLMIAGISWNLMLGGLVGLVVGLGLAFFIEYLDTSVKTMEQVISTTTAPRR